MLGKSLVLGSEAALLSVQSWGACAVSSVPRALLSGLPCQPRMGREMKGST